MVFASVGSFLGDFARELAGLFVPAALLGLLFHLATVALRARAWIGALEAAHPELELPRRKVITACLAGNGVNQVMPAKLGEVLKLYLVHHAQPGQHYPTLLASLATLAPVDMMIGGALVLTALAAGSLGGISFAPDAMAFLASHPLLTLFALAVIGLGLLALAHLHGERLERFARDVRLGLRALGNRRRYLREVAAWQAAAWLARFAMLAAFLWAFGIPFSATIALGILAAQIAAAAIPATVAGLGPQQAAIVAVLPAAAAVSASDATGFAVGMQILISAGALGAALLALPSAVGHRNLRRSLAEARARQAS